jgi:hypothetical protein
MKKLKILAICFVLSLLFSGNAFSQCEGISKTTVGNPSGIQYIDGDNIPYVFDFFVVPGNTCPLSNITVSWWNPDVTPVDDNNLCGDTTDSTVVYNGGIILEPGGDELTLACDCDDSTNPLCIEVPDLCYTVADADAIAGQLLAYFCVEHITEFPGNPLVGSSEDVIPNTLLIPDVAVSKDCVNPDGLPVGVPADFEVIVTNTGETDLSCEAAELNSGAPILLASGEDFSETVPVDTTGECDEDEIVSNEVTVICSVPGAQTPTTVEGTASDTCPVNCSTDIDASKDCDNPGGLPQGVPADFTITVTNVGDTTVSCDDSAGEIGTIELSPGESRSIPYSESTAGECLEDALVSNSTTITCTAINGSGASESVTVSDTCPVTCVPCAIASKACENPGGLPLGTDADFLVTIENCGDLPILCTDSEGELNGGGDIVIDPNAPDYTETVPVSTDEACSDEPYEVSNTTTITCTASDGTVVFDEPVSDTCPVPCDTCIDVVKICTSTELVVPGGPAAFDIIITNCGDVPLEVISIDDPAVGPVLPAGPLVPGESETVSVVIDEALCVDTDNGFEVENTVTVTSEGETATATDVCPCEEEVGGEGCTPGFWKNNAGIDYNYKNGKNAKLQDNCWCGSYSATTTLGEAFGDIPEPFKSDTMIDGINYTGKGGPEYSMLRHAVAALLNACSSDVVSPLTEAGIKDTVVTALKPGGDIAAAHQEFAEANESRTADTCIADDTTEGTCDNTDKPCEDGKCESYHNCPINSHCELKDEAPVEPFNTYLEMLSSEYGVKCGS